MSKIRVLSDQLANQIAAGEVVERPASVAKELVENSIDAGSRRVTIDVEAGGRRLLRVTDDGAGMSRDDAVLAFERHATSKISSAADLAAIATLGFRGEALASIASVARVELLTKTDETIATRVLIEGGRMRDVKDAAHPQGTTITVRDLFFNVPARRKFLRSEATESFHLTNLVTHYALAHPEISFTLTNNGRETLRATPASDLRERAYQIFGPEFLENLLEVDGGHHQVARVRGYVSAPRERRTSRDAQYLFVNGRFVRDRLLGRALSDGYRSVLPHGVYPAALLFLEIPLEEVDVNVHPAKTEVRFRRAAAVADAVREAVRTALASAGFTRPSEPFAENDQGRSESGERPEWTPNEYSAVDSRQDWPPVDEQSEALSSLESERRAASLTHQASLRQERIEFGFAPPEHDTQLREDVNTRPFAKGVVSDPAILVRRDDSVTSEMGDGDPSFPASQLDNGISDNSRLAEPVSTSAPSHAEGLPPLVSAAKAVREVALESISTNIRPLGQLDESFIIATDDVGLLLIDQHVAHERILFDKYRALEGSRQAESQNLLIPETFDLTPAQASAFDSVAPELELYGFGLMRLSGRTVAIKAVPADLPAGEARNILSEVLDTIDSEKRGAARATMRDEIAASLACHAAIKINTPLAAEKMRWLIDRLLLTSSPTTCPHGRPVILRLTTRDIEKGFHRT
ncbi:MAG: mismatch repair protein MutL [Acidobacteriota bacterium]|jgi:DNA mismatch repair protein MutL|nr:mismatch repair protein MutL [Acidobacteriota bacterium]